ncbi:MAG: restriction endonuclease subunit R, partial [Gammaproteobacteria bacterium]|nr:restriction endonuclease subunit R [Gammaproteobacteria bacterium]
LVEHATWQDAVNGAIVTRARLAEIARAEEEKIRPVILYQAQPKNREVTVEKLEKYLVEYEKIAPDTIAVATGEQRELDAIDLGDPHCPVEHVITVQALKEGWDCPFAYVLCSVANVQSATSVEQLLGRVMRMPFARRRGHEKLNRAYTHVPETQFSRAAHALRDKLVETMGFGKDEAAQAVQVAFPGLHGGDAAAAPAAEVVEVDAVPDFSACTPDERAAAAQAVEVRRTDDGKSAVTVTGVLPAAVRDAIAAAAQDQNRQAEIRARLLHKNAEFQKHQSPASRGEKFHPLPQFVIEFDGGELEASPENIESMLAWEPLKQDCILSAGEFSIEETASGFNIDIDDERVAELKIQKGGQWEIPMLWNAKPGWSENELALWLEREIRTRYLTQEVLAVFAVRNVEALLARGHSMETLVRFKFLLARRLQEKLQKLRFDAKQMNYQRVLFGETAPLCRFKFEFRPDPQSYHYNYAYQGGYQFDKHYYGGVIGDLKSDGEEYQCAVALDSMDEVEYWIRNVDRKPNAFWLPLPHDKFYPDFIAQLTDGRVLAVEYKGAHLEAGAGDKKLIGALWERESGGKALFLMPTKKRGAPSVRERIEQKVRAQSGGVRPLTM